jgi:hypothetical protein
LHERISPCGECRYLLKRQAESMTPIRSTALFVMLNPSTAEATLDDPTLRRCRGFAKLWECSGLAVANVYALIANDPAALWSHPDPIGPDNDDYVWNLRASAATWFVHAVRMQGRSAPHASPAS